MLTYQLQKRVFKTENGEFFSFPNNVEIEISLEPSEQFGLGNKPSRTVLPGTKGKIVVDLNVGKSSYLSDSPLDNPIKSKIEYDNLTLEMVGNKLYCKSECKDLNSLNELIITLHYLVPFLLNIDFAEPPVVKYTSGKVGACFFTWILDSLDSSFEVTTREKQEQIVINSFEKLKIFKGTSNRRLAAALYYFYMARRLEEAGNSPYEFMSEIILNFNKVLEILIGSSRKKVRNELLKFGYSTDEIEMKFIPIMILRNDFDVGHVSIKIINEDCLTLLYEYLKKSETDFRDLLKKVIMCVEDGSYIFNEEPKLLLGSDAKKMKIMDDLITTFKARENLESS
jgi:hypothetical protein